MFNFTSTLIKFAAPAAGFAVDSPAYKILTTLSSAKLSQTSEELASATGVPVEEVDKVLSYLYQQGLTYQEQRGYHTLTNYGRAIAEHTTRTPLKTYNYKVPDAEAYSTLLARLGEGLPRAEVEAATPGIRKAFTTLNARGYVDASNPELYELSTLAKRYMEHSTGVREITNEDIQRAYDYFKSQHPEYKSIYHFIDNFSYNKDVFWKDIKKYMEGGPINGLFMAQNAPKIEKWFGGKTIAPHTSLEAAIATELEYAAEAVDALKATNPPKVKDVRVANEYFTLLEQRATPAAVARQLRTFAPGTLLNAQDALNIANKIVGKAYPEGLKSDVVEDRVATIIGQARNTQSGVFFETDADEAIAVALTAMLKKGVVGVKAWGTFYETADTDDVTKVAGLVFAPGSVWRAAQLSGIHFTNALKGVSFVGVDLSGANFGGIDVEECNFTDANLAGADLTDATFKKNIINGADFTNVSGLGDDSTIFEDNVGKPKNLTLRKMKHAQDLLPTVLGMPSMNFVSPDVIVTKEDEVSARATARLIREYLEQRNVLAALKFGASSSESLTDDQRIALKAWVADPAVVPQFVIDSPAISKNPAQWLIDINKGGGLAGLSKNEINTLFGRTRNLMGEKKSKPQVKEAPRLPSVDDLVAQYKSKYGQQLTAENLLDIALDKQGKFGQFLATQTARQSNRDWYTLYNTIVSALNGFHLNTSVQPKRNYQSVPVTSYLSDLSNTAHSVAGAGTQFGVAIVPEYQNMPPEVARTTKVAIDKGGSHLRNALAFSRITPFRYVETNVDGVPIPKYVWAVSEMQSDAYQKGYDKQSEEDGKMFRTYNRHWPENLMNVILEYAGQAGVDEVWMPTHKAVEGKHNNVDSKPNWEPAYDRPAKVFGGQLQNVGVSIQLDPDSSFSHKDNKFYVIPLKQQQAARKAGSCLTWIKYGALTDDQLDKLDTHLNWVIDHNRHNPQFADYQSHVTAEDIAQFAYRTFFDEYRVPKTPENEEQAKEFLWSKYTITIYSPQIDWFHWLKKAHDDVQHFINNQSAISPGMASDTEYARDWWALWWQNDVPQDIKNAPYATAFANAVTKTLEDLGYGDVTNTGFILPPSAEEKAQEIINPTDTGEGETIGGPPNEGLTFEDKIPQGEQAEPSTEVQFSPPGEREQRNLVHDEINRLLDQLSGTQGEEERARIRRRLHEISTLASLRYAAVQRVRYKHNPKWVGKLVRTESNGLVTVQWDNGQYSTLTANNLEQTDAFELPAGQQAPPARTRPRVQDDLYARGLASLTLSPEYVDGGSPRNQESPSSMTDDDTDKPALMTMTRPKSGTPPNMATESMWNIPREGPESDEKLEEPRHDTYDPDVSPYLTFEDMAFRDYATDAKTNWDVASPDVRLVMLFEAGYTKEDWEYAVKGHNSNSDLVRKIRKGMWEDLPPDIQESLVEAHKPDNLKFAAEDTEFSQRNRGLNDWWQYEPAHGEGAPVQGGPEGDGSALDTSNMDMRGGFYTDLNLPDPHKKQKEQVSFEPANHVNLQPSFIASLKLEALDDFVAYKTAVQRGVRALSEFKDLDDQQLTARLADEYQVAKELGLL